MGYPKTARRLVPPRRRTQSRFISLDFSSGPMLLDYTSSRHQLLISDRGCSNAFYGYRHPGAFPVLLQFFCTSTPRRLGWLRVCTDSPSFVPYPAGSLILVFTYTLLRTQNWSSPSTCLLPLRARTIDITLELRAFFLQFAITISLLILIQWPFRCTELRLVYASPCRPTAFSSYASP